ncbi:hypothetical protein ACJX0J_036940, partial [Zea mays]
LQFGFHFKLKMVQEREEVDYGVRRRLKQWQGQDKQWQGQDNRHIEYIQLHAKTHELCEPLLMCLQSNDAQQFFTWKEINEKLLDIVGLIVDAPDLNMFHHIDKKQACL